jgi:hypothetical protein
MPIALGRRRFAAASAGLLAIAVGAVGFGIAWPALSASPPSPSGAPIAAFEAVSAQVTDLTSTVTESCPVGYGEESPLMAQGPGTVTSLPAVEDTVMAGEALYRLDDQPVLLLRGRLPAWRDLTAWMDSGRDIAQAKRALTELGFATRSEIGTSTAWNWPLSEAIADLRESAGHDRAYSLPRSMFTFGPASIRVAALTATPGLVAAPGTEVLTWTDTAPYVTCETETSQRAYATPDAGVTMTFPDGTEASGVIVDVSTKPGETPDDLDKLEVSVGVAADVLVSQDTGTLARVALTHTVAVDVLAVPVTALVALVDGGYGVAKLDGSGSPVYTPVRAGRFAGTLVEITGGDLAAGDQVVVTP